MALPAGSTPSGTAPDRGRLVALEEARRRIDALPLRPLGTEEVPVLEATGRLSAARVTAPHDSPQVPRSAMDGYAIRAAELEGGPLFDLLTVPPEPDTAWPVRASLPVTTGAPIPMGADCVIRLEASQLQGGHLRVHEAGWPGKDIHPAGEDLRKGDLLLEAGQPIRPYELGLLLSVGIDRVRVFQLEVALAAIGDLLTPADRPKAGRTLDSISPILQGLMPGARVRYDGTLPSRPDAVRAFLETATARSQLIVTVGSASVGANDSVKEIVRSMGTLLFDGVSVSVLKRGAVGQVADCPVVVLPGQVVSAVVAWHEHGLHVLSRLAGRELREHEEARLSEELVVKRKMDATYLFRLRHGVAHPLRWGVALYRDLASADAFGFLRHGETYPAGATLALQRLI